MRDLIQKLDAVDFLFLAVAVLWFVFTLRCDEIERQVLHVEHPPKMVAAPVSTPTPAPPMLYFREITFPTGETGVIVEDANGEVRAAFPPTRRSSWMECRFSP